MLRLRIPRYPLHVVLRRAALAYLIIWQLSPPMAYGSGWRALAVIAMLLWLALDTLEARSVLLRPNWTVLATVGFVIYTIGIEWLVPEFGTLNRHFAIWIMLFFLLVGESQQRGYGDEAKFCFWVVLLVMPVWILATLRGIDTVGADVSRTISRSSDVARELTAQGIGGFGFVYTVILCLPFLAQLALRFRPRPEERMQPRWIRRFKRLLIWGNFLLSMLLVLRAGYAIAFILSVLAVLCVLLIRSRQTMPFAISACVVALLVLLASVSLEPVLRSLEGVVAGTEYSAKVRDILESLDDGESTGTLGMRTERYYRSLQLFVENPVIGSLSIVEIGGHSSILDRFAESGIVVGGLFFALLVYVPLRFLRSSHVPIGLGLAFLILAIGFPMLNPVFMSWGLVLYVFSRGAFVVMGLPLDQGGRKPRAEGRLAHAAGAQGLPR